MSTIESPTSINLAPAAPVKALLRDVIWGGLIAAAVIAALAAGPVEAAVLVLR